MSENSHNCINCQHLSLNQNARITYAKFKLTSDISPRTSIHSTCAKNMFKQNTHHIALLIDTQRHAANYIKDCIHYASIS